MSTGLELDATEARLNVLRMIRAGKSGHLGGALSCIDIVAVLYGEEMRVYPGEPRHPDRDRFLLSAGHKAMAQYGVLARHGFFDEALLDTYGSVGSKLAGHPDMHKLPGIEANTGALGHGLPIAAGMALGLRADGRGGRVFVVMGDGELAEGSNWEGAAIASHHRLGNLTAFVDVNSLQISGPTAEVMDMEPIADKFAAFGWATTTIDGNDVDDIRGALRLAREDTDRPLAVVAKTVKSKGISFLEGQLASHYWKPTAEEFAAAEAELRERADRLSGALVGAGV